MDVDLSLALVGAILFILGLLSTILKRLFLTSVLVALLIGVVLGPRVLGLIDPSALGNERGVLEVLARVTLAIALMAAGLQITRADLRRDAARAVTLLSLGMVGMWLAAGLGASLLLGLPVWSGLLLGAIVCPTDPVVASTLVTGRVARDDLSIPVRRTLQLESGANDGLALPLVLLSLAMAPGTSGLGDWWIEALREVGIGVGGGVTLGWIGALLVQRSARDWDVERSSLVNLGLALALLTLGSVHLAGGSGVVAVFVAAIVFSAMQEDTLRDELEALEESIVDLLILPVFTFFGAMLPWDEWASLGWAGVAFGAWALFLRRPLIVWSALGLTDTPMRERVFLAWFGPIGVAALYYSLFAERYRVEHYDEIFAGATLAICFSVVVHSVTATPGGRLFAGRGILETVKHPLRHDVEKKP